MKRKINLVSWTLCALAFAACSEDNDSVNQPEGPASGATRQYVVMSSSGEGTGVYLQLAEDISKGTLNATQDVNGRIFVSGNNDDFVNYDNKYLINLSYPSKGGSTADYITTAWKLSNGQFKQHGDGLALEGDIKARGFFNNYFLGVSALSDNNTYKMRVKYIHMDQFNSAVHDGILRCDDKTSEPGNLFEGEIWDINEIAQYGDYVLIGYTTKIPDPQNPKKSTTNLANNFYLGVYKFDPNDASKEYLKYQNTIVRKSADYPGKEAGQIRSNLRARTENSIKVVDDNIYIFAQGTQANGGKTGDFTETPSALLRISGENIQDGKPVAIDDDFYVNLTEKANNHYLWRTYYLGDHKFCLQLFDGEGKAGIQAGSHKMFGIYDVSTDTFTPVNGFPAASQIYDIALAYALDQEKHTISFEIQEAEGAKPVLYTINSDGTAVRGMEVTTEAMNGVSLLEEKE